MSIEKSIEGAFTGTVERHPVAAVLGTLAFVMALVIGFYYCMFKLGLYLIVEVVKAIKSV